MRRLENRLLDLGVALHAVLIDLAEVVQGRPKGADDGVVVLGQGMG